MPTLAALKFRDDVNQRLIERIDHLDEHMSALKAEYTPLLQSDDYQSLMRGTAFKAEYDELVPLWKQLVTDLDIGLTADLEAALEEADDDEDDLSDDMADWA